MADIAVVGSLNMDLIGQGTHLPRPGETLIGQEFLEVPGGKGANQAYAAARLGACVAMYGCIGNDAHGRALAANLDAVGCDTSRLQTSLAHTGVALIHVGRERGHNAIMVVPGANADYDMRRLLADRSSLIRCRILLLQLEIPLPITLAAARLARKAGVRIIVDPAPATDIPAELYDVSDILTPNESELAALTGVGSASSLTDGQVREAIDLLGVRLRGSLIVKLGERGCIVYERGIITHLPAVPAQVVDTTGAGDVFNAALAVALLAGKDLIAAACFASHAAALSVCGKGAQSAAPTRQQVDESMALSSHPSQARNCSE